MHQGLEALGERLALVWLHDQLETEAAGLCGAPRGKHNAARRGRRHGYESGSVVLGGRRVAVVRPRVRARGGCGELVPPTYVLAQDEAFLSKAMITETVAGAAQWRYAAIVGAAAEQPGGAPAGSVSRSTVSGRCAEQMQALLEEVCSRDLGREPYLVVLLDGVEMGGHRVIAGLGVTAAGDKQVIGLWEGATESKEVCRAAIEDLAARGLTAERGLLVVLDGGKGLDAAVRAVWGERAVIQRCQAHKARNLRDHLPAQCAETVLARMHRAWAQPDAARGERRLRELAAELERDGRTDAAGSLREGLAESGGLRRACSAAFTSVLKP